MEANKYLIIKDYLSNLQVNIIEAVYVHCPESWNYYNFFPECSKFYFICGGEGCIKIGNKEFYPKPYQLFLLPAGTVQSLSTISKNTFTKYCCHFTATIGEMNFFDIVKLPYYMEVMEISLIEYLFKQLINDYENHELAASLRIKSVLFQIIAYFIANAHTEKISLLSTEPLQKLTMVIDYIKSNLSKNITIIELAKIVNLHPNYFIKLFKAHMGSSPIQYINKMKLEKAKSLLRTTDISISEIAESIGFFDVFYFSKTFKRYSGFCPSDFRSMQN